MYSVGTGLIRYVVITISARGIWQLASNRFVSYLAPAVCTKLELHGRFLFDVNFLTMMCSRLLTLGLSVESQSVSFTKIIVRVTLSYG